LRNLIVLEGDIQVTIPYALYARQRLRGLYSRAERKFVVIGHSTSRHRGGVSIFCGKLSSLNPKENHRSKALHARTRVRES